MFPGLCIVWILAFQFLILSFDSNNAQNINKYIKVKHLDINQINSVYILQHYVAAEYHKQKSV